MFGKAKPLLLVTISLLTPGCSSDTDRVNPKLSSDLQNLIEAEKRGEAEEYAERKGIELVDGNVSVIVESEPNMIEEATKAAQVLGVEEIKTIVREGYVYPRFRALIAITSLNALADEKSVKRVDLPGAVIPYETS